MLRQFTMFYAEKNIWDSLDRQILSEVHDTRNELYQQALKVALDGAATVSPVANRYSARVENSVWHINFKSANLPHPNDNQTNGFAYTKINDQSHFIRIHFTEEDTKKILFEINNYYGRQLKPSH